MLFPRFSIYSYDYINRIFLNLNDKIPSFISFSNFALFKFINLNAKFLIFEENSSFCFTCVFFSIKISFSSYSLNKSKKKKKREAISFHSNLFIFRQFLLITLQQMVDHGMKTYPGEFYNKKKIHPVPFSRKAFSLVSIE